MSAVLWSLAIFTDIQSRFYLVKIVINGTPGIQHTQASADVKAFFFFQMLLLQGLDMFLSFPCENNTQ